jgi:adenylylsulfate kinase-like enzyme
MLSNKKIKIDQKKGICIWITGLAGSGKTAIAKKIRSRFAKLYGPTILVSGDDIRNIFGLYKFTKEERQKNAINFGKLSKFVINQKINIILATIGMFEKARKNNRKNIKNYIEVYIKADIKTIIKIGKKKIYKRFNRNIVGLDIKPELPENPDIIIKNDFNTSVEKLSDKLIKSLKKKLK